MILPEDLQKQMEIFSDIMRHYDSTELKSEIERSKVYDTLAEIGTIDNNIILFLISMIEQLSFEKDELSRRVDVLEKIIGADIREKKNLFNTYQNDIIMLENKY